MLTNGKAVELLNFLESPLSNDLELSLKGNIILQSNIKLLKACVEDLKEVEKRYKKSKEIEEYEAEKIKSLDPYLEKDSLGKHIMLSKNEFKYDKKNEEAIKHVLLNLNKKYEGPILEHNKKSNEWNEFFFTKESAVKLAKISQNEFFIPSNMKIKKSIFEALLQMIDISEPVEEEPVKEEKN